MATFINMGFLNDSGMDAVVQAAEHIAPIIKEKGSDAEANAFDEKFKKLYEEENYFELFGLLVEKSNLLFDVINDANDRAPKEREAEGYFTVLISLLMQMEDEESLNKTTDKLCETFGSDTSSGELRLKLFMMLYNTFQPAFALRHPVFMKTLAFAAEAKQFDSMAPYLERLDEWIADWEITVAQKRELYLVISTKMRDLGRRAPAFEWLKKHCALYQGDDDALKTKEATQAGMTLAVDAITLPQVLQMDDLLQLQVIQGLGKSKEHKPLMDLMTIFMEGEVEDLVKLHGANKQLFDKHNVSLEEATAKMRLLTIASLAQGKQELPLSEIADALKEKDEKIIEKWVVRSISEGVIDGRIDQMRKTLLIKSSLQRVFGKKEWQFLATKLDSWIQNIDSLLLLVQNQGTMTRTDSMGGA